MKTTPVTRLSPISGRYHTIDLPISSEDYAIGLKRWKSGVSIQIAFSSLCASDREFIMSGITPGEWDAMFNDDECCEEAAIND